MIITEQVRNAVSSEHQHLVQQVVPLLERLACGSFNADQNVTEMVRQGNEPVVGFGSRVRQHVGGFVKLPVTKVERADRRVIEQHKR